MNYNLTAISLQFFFFSLFCHDSTHEHSNMNRGPWNMCRPFGQTSDQDADRPDTDAVRHCNHCTAHHAVPVLTCSLWSIAKHLVTPPTPSPPRPPHPHLFQCFSHQLFQNEMKEWSSHTYTHTHAYDHTRMHACTHNHFSHTQLYSIHTRTHTHHQPTPMQKWEMDRRRGRNQHPQHKHNLNFVSPAQKPTTTTTKSKASHLKTKTTALTVIYITRQQSCPLPTKKERKKNNPNHMENPPTHTKNKQQTTKLKMALQCKTEALAELSNPESRRTPNRTLQKTTTKNNNNKKLCYSTKNRSTSWTQRHRIKTTPNPTFRKPKN